MIDYWDDIKYFTYKEFISKNDWVAQATDGLDMDEELIRALDYVREQLGYPLYINSGYRSLEYNRSIGSNDLSQHPKKKAADIHITNEDMGDLIEYYFIEYVGVNCGIGRYNTFIHIDTRGYKARWDDRTL